VIAQICDSYGKLPSEPCVRRLTWPQVVAIIWHERDEFGAVRFHKPPITTPEDVFREKWRAWGLTEEEVGLKWDEFLTVEGHRWHLEQQQAPDIDAQVAEFQPLLAHQGYVAGDERPKVVGPVSIRNGLSDRDRHLPF
jgi:hypothetical protein